MSGDIHLLQYLLGSYQPYPDTEPTRSMIWRLGKMWADDYAGPLFDSLPEDASYGWKTDWLRGSKHFFLGYVLGGVLWPHGYVPASSFEVLREPLAQILNWLDGRQPFAKFDVGEDAQFANHARRQVLVRSLLGDYAFNVWAEANAIRLRNFKEYSMRAPRDLIPVNELPKKWQKEMKDE